MTNKFLEDAARAQAALEFSESTDNSSSAEALEFAAEHWELFTSSAQAVFDSAKILLLPADAGPEIGMVGVYRGCYVHWLTNEVSGKWSHIDSDLENIIINAQEVEIIRFKGQTVLQESDNE